MELRLVESGISGQVILARPDVERLIALDADGDGAITGAELDRRFPELTRFAAGALELRAGGASVAAEAGRVWLDDSNGVHFAVRWPSLPGDRFRIRSAVPSAFPFGHRQFFSLVDSGGRKLEERILDARAAELEIDVHGAARSRFFAAGEFVVLGIRHILTGYDHLMFLLGLLVVGSRFWDAARIVTAFTVAHSITLGLAAFDVVSVPQRVVEPLIAVTIVYVGIENLAGAHLNRRWMLAFVFGLIHGFGFSSALRDLGIGAGGSGIAVPLFSFNLGVELGQAAVAAPILPIIWRLRRHPAFVSRWIPAGSLLIALLGAYWLIQRTLG